MYIAHAEALETVSQYQFLSFLVTRARVCSLLSSLENEFLVDHQLSSEGISVALCGAVHIVASSTSEHYLLFVRFLAASAFYRFRKSGTVSAGWKAAERAVCFSLSPSQAHSLLIKIRYAHRRRYEKIGKIERQEKS